MNRSHVLIFLGMIIVAGAVVYSKTNTSRPVSAIDPQTNQMRESYRADLKRSPQAAYASFKQSNATNSNRHTMAHVFGEELYAETGVEGVAICDDTFEFGCYHGFFSAGLANADLETIYQFDQACEEKWGDKSLPCEHGIGHGVMSQVLSLEEALGWCKKIMRQPTGGCISGVFMEYNFPTLSDHSGTQARKLADENYYSPCTAVANEFRNACYFELPQWWLSVMGHDFPKLGSLCEDIKITDNRQWCFYGIGNYSAATANFDVNKAAAYCDSLPAEDGTAWCRESAAWLFLPQPNAKSNINVLCKQNQQCLDRLKSNSFYED